MVDSAAGSPRVVPVPNLMREMIMYAMKWPLDRSPDDMSAAYFKCFATLCAGWVSREVNLVLPASADARIDAIMSYTRRNIATVALPDVCQAVGMSERSLRRHFRKAVGMTWEAFRQRQRIFLAIDALDNTTKSIGAIAADVGYENQAAFAKTFKTVVGVGPSHYRKSRHVR
ncbi:MAG: AraC family transcriptional regulator [Rhodospirillaceae bacterium]|nr:MAG: AraC family transcriptional regulator [Rhodospirillaceae bacterium]